MRITISENILFVFDNEQTYFGSRMTQNIKIRNANVSEHELTNGSVIQFISTKNRTYVQIGGDYYKMVSDITETYNTVGEAKALPGVFNFG